MFQRPQRRALQPHRLAAWGLTVCIHCSAAVALLVHSGGQLVEGIPKPPIAWNLVMDMPTPPVLDIPAPQMPAPAPAAAPATTGSTPQSSAALRSPSPTPLQDHVQPSLEDFSAVLADLTAAAIPSTGTGPASEGCPPGADCAATAPSPCPPGMRCDGTSLVVSGADVRVRRRVTPRYPAAARTLDIAETRCIVAFSISSRGLPESIHIDGCPQVFHASLREAAQQWRFYPVRDATGQPSPASFRLAVVFKLQD